jgi:transposase-like protein
VVTGQVSGSPPGRDWDAIRKAYTGTRASVRQIARDFGVTHPAILKKAKAEGWIRPAPEPPVTAPPRADRPRPALDRASEGPDASTLSNRGRSIIERMLDELETVTAYIGEIEEAIIAETAADKSLERRRAWLNAVSLRSRAQTAKDLATALKTLGETTTDAGAGKKAKAKEAGKQAGTGTAWEGDLAPHGGAPGRPN